jgi:hypothetical protein
MDWIYGSRDHGWLSVHGGLVTMGRRGPLGLGGRRDCLERERERKEVIRILTNGATWRRSYRDGHMTTLKRGGR